MSVYDDEKERQRRADLMKVAVGSNDYDEDDDDDEGLSRRGGGRSSKGGVDPSSSPALESARKFLWDEDVDAMVVPLGAGAAAPALTGTQNLFSSKDYQVEERNLMDPQHQQGHPSGAPPQGYVSSLFRGRTSEHEIRHGDAAFSSEAQEYLSKKKRRFNNPFISLVSMCRYCMSCICTPSFAKFLLLLVALAAAVFAVGGVLAILQNGDKEMSPEAREEAFRAQFGRVSGMETLTARGTPQYKAVRWIAKDDPSKLSLDHAEVLQRYVLAVLFFSFGGEIGSGQGDGGATKGKVFTFWKNDDNWMTEAGLCDWYGVECIGEEADGEGYVFILNMTSNNITRAAIPSELHALRLLEKLDFSHNEVGGTIPQELTDSPLLREIILYDNKLNGMIPSKIGKLSHLRELQLGQNDLHGEIPTGINLCTHLKTLGLEDNKLDGVIEDLTNLSSLTYLYLHKNQLTGKIPRFFASNKSLKEMKLQENRFTGGISRSFWGMSNLEVLNLSQNTLTGTLPVELIGMANLREFKANENFFSGEVPTELGALSRLKELHLQRNDFAGTMPLQVCKLVDDHILTSLGADCEELKCECCHGCFTDGQ